MRKLARFCAFFTTCLFLAGAVCCFVFAWKTGADATVWCVVGLLLSFCLAPVVHECGHILVGKTQAMRLTYSKFFCFKWQEREGKLRFSFASPFLAEQTQTVPVKSGNMKKRAARYTAGGLLFGAGSFVLFAAVATASVLLRNEVAFLFFGLLPYTGYLTLLNCFPVYYAGGATDALVLKGIKNGNAAETVMLSAMEIFGFLSEGKSFSEIDEDLYFSLPVVAEDLPVYATIADLRYRYLIEKGDLEKAGEALNRLAALSGYLDEGQIEEIAAELSYMHALLGDTERAGEARKVCENYLAAATPQAKRIQAAYYFALGDTERAEQEKALALSLLSKERILGKQKAERILLDRIG